MVDILEGQVFDLVADIEQCNKEISHIKEENALIRESLKDERYKSAVLESRLNDSEQYSRKNNIRIFGIKDNRLNESHLETEAIVLKMFNDKLKLRYHDRGPLGQRATGGFEGLKGFFDVIFLNPSPWGGGGD